MKEERNFEKGLKSFWENFQSFSEKKNFVCLLSFVQKRNQMNLDLKMNERKTKQNNYIYV